MINISKEANQVLNIVKAKYNLKDKSEAIDKVVLEYGQDLMEPELRPEFIAELERIRKEGKYISFKDIDEFDKHFGMK